MYPGWEMPEGEADDVARLRDKFYSEAIRLWTDGAVDSNAFNDFAGRMRDSNLSPPRLVSATREFLRQVNLGRDVGQYGSHTDPLDVKKSKKDEAAEINGEMTAAVDDYSRSHGIDDLLRLRDGLEMRADILCARGAVDKKSFTAYLAKLQSPDLRAQDIVRATRDFVSGIDRQRDASLYGQRDDSPELKRLIKAEVERTATAMTKSVDEFSRAYGVENQKVSIAAPAANAPRPLLKLSANSPA